MRAIIATLRSRRIAQMVLVIAELIWLIPNRRIEKRVCRVAGPVDLDPNDKGGVTKWEFRRE